MKQHQNIEEQLVKLLLSKYNESKNAEVSITQKDVQNLNLSEKEVVKTIYIMKDKGLLDIGFHSAHDNFSTCWKLTLKRPCIEYSEIQKANKRNERRKTFKEFRALIILLISILAFCLFVYLIYLQYYQMP